MIRRCRNVSQSLPDVQKNARDLLDVGELRVVGRCVSLKGRE
jgi:hypothetical protein